MGSEERPLRLALDFVRGAAQICAVQVCVMAVGILTLSRVGRIGALELAAASLGSLSFNVLGQMLMNAPMGALEEIGAQAWGAGRPAEVGLAAQRAVLTGCVLVLPALAMWPSAEAILVALGQPPEVAALSATFMHWCLPSLFLVAVFKAEERWCYAMGCRWPPLLAALCGTCSLLVWQELVRHIPPPTVPVLPRAPAPSHGPQRASHARSKVPTARPPTAHVPTRA